MILALLFFVSDALAVNRTSYPENRDMNFTASKVYTNYVKNSGCFRGTDNITTANSGSITRNETTPLIGPGDCRIFLANNSNAFVEWDTYQPDYWLYNRECEARLIYKTASVPSKVSFDVYVGSTSYPGSPLTFVSQEARVFSKKFPCGNLQNKPTVRVTNNPGNAAGFIVYISDVYIGSYTSYPYTGGGL